MNWNWSFRAFRLWGTDVRIHWSLPAFFLYYVVRAATHDVSATFLLLFVITPFLLLFGSVILHEYGHIFAARHFRLHVGHTILTPIGGMVMVGRARTPWSEFVVAGWGPLVNLGLVIVGGALYALLGGPLSASLVLPVLADDAFGQLYAQGFVGLLVLHDFVQANALLLLFNVLMVAYPMDGGRMLLAALWKTKGYRRGMTLACQVSRGVAVLMGIGAIVWSSILLGVIAVFVWLQASRMLSQIHLLDDPSRGHSSSYREGLRERERQIRQELKQLRGSWLRRWWEQRQTQRYVALLHKAETEGIHSLSKRERAILRKVRERRD